MSCSKRISIGSDGFGKPPALEIGNPRKPQMLSIRSMLCGCVLKNPWFYHLAH